MTAFEFFLLVLSKMFVVMAVVLACLRARGPSQRTREFNVMLSRCESHSRRQDEYHGRFATDPNFRRMEWMMLTRDLDQVREWERSWREQHPEVPQLPNWDEHNDER